MTQFPPYVLPNAILYDVTFIGILALVLEFVALLPVLRRTYFAAVLILVGIIEGIIVSSSGYSLPLEQPGIPFVTILSGFIIPIFYRIRTFLSRKRVQFLLIFSGCLESALGALCLFNLDIVGAPYVNGFLIMSLNVELYLIGILLATVGVYSLAVGMFLFARPLMLRKRGY